MPFALCNELCEGWDFPRVCTLAADAGYAGVEIAPFTLAPSVHEITADQRRAVKQAAADHGLEIVGLHWLLAKTQGLHISDPDPTVRARTLDYYRALIECCAAMGGNRMIHGSPAQRNVPAGMDPDQAWRRAADFFAEVAPAAAEHGVTICLEPLAPAETDFLTSRDEAVRLMNEVDHPAVRLILDCKAMAGDTSGRPIPELIRESKDELAHFHANDDTGGHPGTGSLDFGPILAGLRAIDYRGWISVEVFDFTPGPERIAREAMAHLRGALEEAEGA